MKKYELLKEDTRIIEGKTLYRIKALKDFRGVSKGDLGGYIEKEENLSQNDNCWIYDESCVYDNAMISGNGKVFGYANIYDNAIICGNALVYGNAIISGNVIIYGHAKVSGNAEVYGHAEVSGNVEVYGHAIIYGYAKVYGYTEVYNYAKVYGYTEIDGNIVLRNNDIIDNKNNILSISNIGSRNATTTFIKYPDKSIHVNCGCFSGTIDEFKQKVLKTHKNNEKYKKEYLYAIEFVLHKFEL